MEYRVVIQNIFVLFALIGVGFLAGKKRVVSPDASKDLTNLLMKITLPATIFASLIRPYDSGLLKDSVICFVFGIVFFLFSMALAFFLAKRMHVQSGKRGVWILAATFSNTGFVGFPVANAVFGAEGLFLASMINLAFNILVFSVGVKIACMDSEESGVISLKKILVGNVNIAIVLGLFFFITQISVPDPVMTLVNYFGGVTTPLSMFIIGLTMSRGRLKDLFTDMDAFVVSLIRLVAMPILAFVLLKLLPFEAGSMIPGLAVLIIAMPAPSVCMILAEQYGGNTDFAGKAIFISSLLCMITIPGILLLI